MCTYFTEVHNEIGKHTEVSLSRNIGKEHELNSAEHSILLWNKNDALSKMAVIR